MEIASGAALAVFNTGTTVTYIPDELLSIITAALCLQKNSFTGGYTMDCSAGSNYFLTFNFQGFEIQVPLSSFLINLKSSIHGRTSSLCQLMLMPSGDLKVYLGDSFLRNVYFVVDLEDHVVGMAPANLGSGGSDDDEDIEVFSGDGDGIPSAVSVASFEKTWGWGDENTATATALSVNWSPSTVSMSSYAVAVTDGANVRHSGNTIAT
ncbi:unnamed protein product [Ambrosiozyma monospora]|uniref:Unnamed protein product n=1 Tax=Ambrosiozyma monospora TaxID=43982 RepID=A0ACB5U7C4_AMBMO|nr:unnamed protein product [Ambrosiozyma monospora]